MSTTFAQAVAALTEELGAPTHTRPSHCGSLMRPRAAWDSKTVRADGWSSYVTHVAVVDDTRGVIVYARRDLSRIDIDAPEMMVSAPYAGCANPHTLKRLARAVEVLAVPRWELGPVLTTLAVAVEVVAVVATPGEYL